MSALRTSIVLSALALTGCDNILGLHDITPDGEAVSLSLKVANTGIARQPLGVVTVLALDVLGKPVKTFTGEVRLSFGNNPTSANLLGELTATATGGQASFSVVGIDQPGAGYTLVAAVDGLPPVTSDPIAVVAPRFTPLATGLAGSVIYEIAVSPSSTGGAGTVFVRAADGVHKSVDAGANWTAANFDFLGQGFVVADPSQPRVLYHRTDFGSYRKTTDGGATWHTLRDIPNPSAFAIDPRDSSVLYVRSADVNSGDTLRRSADRGATWTTVNLHNNCLSLAVDAVVADALYCVVYDPISGRQSGIAKSTDGGATWKPANNGLGTPVGYVQYVVATPMGVFTAVGNMTYRSIDGASSWAVVSPLSSNAVAHAPSMPNRIYLAQGGGIAVSTNGGVSFGASVSVSGDYIQTLAVDPTNLNLVYAGGLLGLYVSTDGGTSFSPSSRGINAPTVTSVAMAPGTPSTVLVTTRQDVLRSTNGGASWSDAVRPNVTVHFDPDVSTRVYLCGYSTFATSTDSGANFTAGTPTGLVNSCVRLLVGSNSWFSSGSGGGNRLTKSVDKGASWADANLPAGILVYDAALGDLTGSVVVAATTNGLYRSTNAGDSFIWLGSANPVNAVTTLVTDPKLVTRMVEANSGSLATSVDAGESFGSKITVGSVQSLSATGGALYRTGYGTSTFGTTTMELSRSTDGGTTWANVEIGISVPVSITAIAASDDGNTVYLATNAGLFKGSFN